MRYLGEKILQRRRARLCCRHVQTSTRPRDYRAAIEALNSVQSNHTTVEKVQELRRKGCTNPIAEMQRLCRQLDYEPSAFDSLNSIHIAGTKGKGSTAAFVSAILLQYADRLASPASDKPAKIGLYTSPHIRSIRERIRLDDTPLSEELFAKYTFQVWDKFVDPGDDPAKSDTGLFDTQLNYFRCLTLIALHCFMSEGVRSAVIECGIGGEEDTTNILVQPSISAVTSLGIDHEAMLGNTIEEIAWHKAGIFKPGVPAFTVPQPEAAMQVLKQRAAEKGTHLQVIAQSSAVKDLKLGLSGDVQQLNASLATAVVAAHLRRMGVNDVPKSVHDNLPAPFRRGLEAARLAGRFDRRQDRTSNICWYLDGGHTLDSIQLSGKWFDTSIAAKNTVKSPTRILIFNQQTRDAFALSRRLYDVLTSATDSKRPFTNVIFCSNRTYIKSGFSAELVSLSVISAEVEALSVQHALAKNWANIDPNTTVTVVRTVEEAVGEARRIAESVAVADDEVKVLVTGSMHLVGGVIEVLESEQESGRTFV